MKLNKDLTLDRDHSHPESNFPRIHSVLAKAAILKKPKRRGLKRKSEEKIHQMPRMFSSTGTAEAVSTSITVCNSNAWMHQTATGSNAGASMSVMEITGAMTTPTGSGSGPIGMRMMALQTTLILPALVLMECCKPHLA